MPSTERWLHFACGSCGAKYASKLDKAPAGSFQVPCRKCGTAIVVPEEGRVISDKALPLIGVPSAPGAS